MEHIYDTIIIGGGPGGYTAALYTARAGLDTLVLEKLSAGGQMAQTEQIDNYPGFADGIGGFELAQQMHRQAERFGAKTQNVEVDKVDLNAEPKLIYTSEGIFRSKTVVIATGANPRKLGLPNEDELLGRGVAYCAACDCMFYKGKTVAVIGGGNSAAEDALLLSRIADKVIIIHRRDNLRATKIYHQPLENANNVEFVWNSTVEEILADDRVTGVNIKNIITQQVNHLPCDGVFISIGRRPATEFLNNAVLIDGNGYIIADETTKTNMDGVFAVGDVRTKALRQVVTAVSDGAAAAHFAEEYISASY